MNRHHAPKGFSDRLACAFTRFLRFFADTFFSRRYGHRAVVLETVAAVPGMIGGAVQHLRSLRRMEGDRGWIRTLLEEAIRSYTEYLAEVDNSTHPDVPASRIAIDYWTLAPDARLRDLIFAVRADEVHHHDVNYRFADELT